MHIASDTIRAGPAVDVPGGARALALLNGWQRGFPLCSRPFAVIGRALGMAEAEVIALCRQLHEQGYISRIGAVVQPHTAGASTLAALAVPAARLAEVAALVSAQPEVTHNYEREHAFNLWFVVTAADRAAVRAALARIAAASRLPVLEVPMRRAFHIDLGFALPQAGGAHLPHNAGARAAAGQVTAATVEPAPFDRLLLAAIEDGLPLRPDPFAAVATRLGCSEAVVLQRLAALLEGGVIRRFGVVVHHRRLGYRANGMVVWDVPDALVARAGRVLAAAAGVTLCYERQRQRPVWPYNLFCMIHGRARDAVRRRVRELAELLRDELGQDIDHEVLFSRRCFKQRGARFSLPGAAS